MKAKFEPNQNDEVFIIQFLMSTMTTTTDGNGRNEDKKIRGHFKTNNTKKWGESFTIFIRRYFPIIFTNVISLDFNLANKTNKQTKKEPRTTTVFRVDNPNTKRRKKTFQTSQLTLALPMTLLSSHTRTHIKKYNPISVSFRTLKRMFYLTFGKMFLSLFGLLNVCASE